MSNLKTIKLSKMSDDYNTKIAEAVAASARLVAHRNHMMRLAYFEQMRIEEEDKQQMQRLAKVWRYY